MKRLLAFSIPLILLTSCQTPTPPKPKSKSLQVVVTTDLLADLVSNICGHNCNITILIPKNQNPHTYKPTPENLESLKNADLVYSIGFDFEPNLAESLKAQSNKSFTFEESFNKQQLIKVNNQTDPHFWMSLELARQSSAAIASLFTDKYPDLNEAIVKQQSSYVQELHRLDTYIQQTLEPIPAKKRVLATNHDGFRYFCKLYNFETISVESLKSDSDTKEIDKLAETIASRKIASIFIEPGLDPTKIRILQKAVRAKGWQVRIGGELAVDSLGKNSSYIEMMRNNASTIAAGLKE